ncbi:NAD(P)H-binding protein [Geodermatophilus sabuli]|uniref:NAD(P)H-binding protein n=1 Tax=Geodermatophilus sabuli TaxID=1564158 RepID=A0A7K3W0F8_9ACTN|nr:NAD(P)H-binding protein [Geodermatophilus sabuli]NEK58361.1 NAD(P)H-binding protein [Geodermatophilus sabuli]
MDVVITGGTGRLGPRVAEHLQGTASRVRLMSRRGTGPGGVRGDLATGRDLAPALAGAEVVVHAASDPRGDYWQTDVAGTRRLVQAVDRDRLRHLVYVSIVGVDRIPFGYYHAKFAAEQVLLASGLPVTLLRITQFHDFVDELLSTARRGPVLPVPMGWRAQPVDVGEAAARTAEVAAGPPAGDVVEYAGPEELTAAELARAWSAAREPNARVVATPVPGRLSSAFRDGAALPSGGTRGRRTYAEHLQGQGPHPA